jgi:hypothetical protein
MEQVEDEDHHLNKIKMIWMKEINDYQLQQDDLLIVLPKFHERFLLKLPIISTKKKKKRYENSK